MVKRSSTTIERKELENAEKTSGGFLAATFKILWKHKLYFVTAAFVAFLVYSFFHGVWKIPLLEFGFARMSRVTLVDYLFLAAVTLFIAIFFTLAKEESLMRLRHDAGPLGKSSGVFAGVISAACPVCQGLTIAALGSTIFTIPLGFLVPYLGFLKIGSLALLGLAVFFRADSLYTKTCPIPLLRRTRTRMKRKTTIEPLLFRSNLAFASVMVLVALVVFNQFAIPQAYAFNTMGAGGSVNLGGFEYGSKMTLKPMPLASGEEPIISGYRSKVKSLPTISELQLQPSTGDATQDLLQNIIPSGTPWYGPEAGVSFDDPIAAQKLWAKGEGIQLDKDQEERWKRIVNSFTCDYCCGSPQQPTIITQCGCAHAAAARGMAKWFIKNYGDKYSDEEIYGEMARWYAKWYPKGTIERILQESQVNQ